MTLITSHQNPKIKQIRSLSQRKQRQAQKLFVVEGIHHIGEAVEAGAPIEYLVYSSELLTSEFAYTLINQLEVTNVPVFKTTADIFTSMAEKENPQGILAVVRHNLTSLAQLNPDTFPWAVAVLSPQDPGNLGTILRTLDAAGASGLLILDSGVDIFHPTAVRASMGALFSRPVVHTNFEEFSIWAHFHEYHIYGTSAHGAQDYTQVNYQHPAILLLGSEREGLNKEQIAVCETLLRLPMAGRATSLNLSIAAGIFLYEMRKTLEHTSKKPLKGRP